MRDAIAAGIASRDGLPSYSEDIFLTDGAAAPVLFSLIIIHIVFFFLDNDATFFLSLVTVGPLDSITHIKLF